MVRSARRPRRHLYAVLLIVAAASAVAGCVYLYAQRHVHRVSIGPGERTSLTVEVPMQRFGRSKSFAKERHLPVNCTLTAPDAGRGGVSVTVLETGHKVHMIWARLLVSADITAPRGRRERRVEFTIDGQGDWPTATVIVDVKRPRS